MSEYSSDPSDPAAVATATARAFDLHRSGDRAGAGRIYADAILSAPDHGDAYLGLGVLALDDDPSAAVHLLGRAGFLGSDGWAVNFNLGLARLNRAERVHAVAAFTRALAVDPGSADAYDMLGLAWRGLGHADRAAPNFMRAICLDGKAAAAQRWDHLGHALSELGHPLAAALRHRNAVILEPGRAEGWANLAVPLRPAGYPVDAAIMLNRALILDPQRIEAHLLRVAWAQDAGRYFEAIEVARWAIVLDPARGPSTLALGTGYLAVGLAARAIVWLARSTLVSPADTWNHDSLIMAMHYDPLLPGPHIRLLAQAYSRRFDNAHVVERFPGRDSDPDRKLRIGFVSADFKLHPVGRFLLTPLRHIDRERFEVYCYSNQTEDDDFTLKRLMPASDFWCRTAGMSAEMMAAQIRHDEIDVLIDLSGHTTGNRLDVFALRPAPVQLTWIGFPGTTGLSKIDWIVVDDKFVPVGCETEFLEWVLRLPVPGWCYTPPDDSPEPGPPPSAAGKPITFGSFSNPSKICPSTIETWAEILKRVPGSRLVLKFRGLEDEGTATRFREEFARQGVADDQLRLEPASVFKDLFEAYGEIDIALDTFPFNGGATTCDALWMGVPVLSFPGQTMAGRMGSSFLTAIGLDEVLLARDRDDYVERAVALADDAALLAELRRTIRPKMQASRLCDGAAFVDGLQTAFRTAWRSWCERYGDSPVYVPPESS